MLFLACCVSRYDLYVPVPFAKLFSRQGVCPGCRCQRFAFYRQAVLDVVEMHDKVLVDVQLAFPAKGDGYAGDVAPCCRF